MGRHLPFTPEFRLLLLSACPQLEPAEVEQLVHLCQDSLDWQAFVGLVDRHGVPGLVYLNLSRYGRGHIPAQVELELKACFEKNKRQALILTAELLRLTRQFDKAGLDIVSLKGPVLSQQLFGDFAVRQSKDIDFFIHPDAFEEAEQIVFANGYERIRSTDGFSALQRKTYFALTNQIGYVHPAHHTNLEINWRFSHYPILSAADEAGMMARAHTLALSGVALKVFCDEDLLAYLLIHGAKHAWHRLKWLVDIVALLRRDPAPNWEGAAATLTNAGLGRPLAQGLLLAKDLFGIPPPAAVRPVIESEPYAPALVEYALQTLLQPGHNPDPLRLLQYLLGLKKDFRYRWAVLKAEFYCPSDWKTVPLPDALFPLYFILRPILIVWRKLRRNSD